MIYRLCRSKTNLRLILLIDKFPSSAAFDAIQAAINASDADRKDAIKQGNGIYAFTLKNASGDEASWHIDLKESGKVATGTGEKPDGKLRPRRARASLLGADLTNIRVL